MLLLFDVGNTNIVLGVYDKDAFLYHWRISTDKGKTSDEYGLLLRQLFLANNLSLEQVEEVVISSVVPPLNISLTEMVKEYINKTPLVIGPGVKTGMPISFDNPKEVGADRIVNSVAAYEKYGGPCIVLDFGTATTYDAVSEKGVYLGGAIAPGVGISTEALFQHAAKLPKIELMKPDKVIGKNTVACMQAGVVYGYLGQIEGIVERMKKELGKNSKVIATGGLAVLFYQETASIDYYEPFLTIEGLKIIYERNRDSRSKNA